MSSNSALHPVEDVKVVAAVRVAIELTSQVDGDSSARAATRTAIFNALAWEEEAIWQCVHAIAAMAGWPVSELREPLAAVLKKLSPG